MKKQSRKTSDLDEYLEEPSSGFDSFLALSFVLVLLSPVILGFVKLWWYSLLFVWSAGK